MILNWTLTQFEKQAPHLVGDVFEHFCKAAAFVNVMWRDKEVHSSAAAL